MYETQDITYAGEFKVSRRLAKDLQGFQIGLGRKSAYFFLSLSLPKSFIRLVTHTFISEIF